MGMNTQLEMVRGDSAQFLLTVKNKDGSPFDLTGWAITMTAKKKKTDVSPFFQIGTVSGDIVIRAPATGGLADITIPQASTTPLTSDTTLFFDIEVTKALLRFTVDSGTLFIRYDVGS